MIYSSFFKWDSTIAIPNGAICFHTITEFRGVNWKQIEEENKKGEYLLSSPVFITTANGDVETLSVAYHGKYYFDKIIFEDDSFIFLFPNAQVSIVDMLGDDPQWVKVKSLVPGQSLLTRSGGALTVKSKESSFIEDHLWGLNSQQSHTYYIQNDILIK